MRDYLEELLDLLTQEDEEAADVWKAQAASLILPKTLDAEAPEGVLNVPEGALELSEGMAAEEAGSDEGGGRFWTEWEPALEPALEFGDTEFEETEIAPGLDGTLDQKAALPDAPGELDEAFASGGKRPVMREDGPAEAATVLLEQARSRRRPVLPEQAGSQRRSALLEQIRSRKRPVLLQQAQDLERQAGQAQALAQERWSRTLASALTFPSRGQTSLSSQTAAGSGGGQNTDGTVWPVREDQARLIDRAFQRDSRRYDRGFSLY